MAFTRRSTAQSLFLIFPLLIASGCSKEPADGSSASVPSAPAAAPSDAAPAQPAAQPGRVDLGLDYGLSTFGDLGLSHTLTFRILY